MRFRTRCSEVMLRRFEQAMSPQQWVAQCYPCLVHTGLAVCPDFIWDFMGGPPGPWDEVVARWETEIAAPFSQAMVARAARDGLRVVSFETCNKWELMEGSDSRLAWVEVVSPDGESYGYQVDVEGLCWFGSDQLGAIARDWGSQLAAARANNPYDFELERRRAEREMVTAELESQGIDIYQEARLGNPKAKFATSPFRYERDLQAEAAYPQQPRRLE